MLTTLTEQQVHIPARGVTLEGNLVIPPKAHTAVLFAHGSGSSRHSPRNGSWQACSRRRASELYFSTS